MSVVLVPLKTLRRHIVYVHGLAGGSIRNIAMWVKRSLQDVIPIYHVVLRRKTITLEDKNIVTEINLSARDNFAKVVISESPCSEPTSHQC